MHEKTTKPGEDAPAAAQADELESARALLAAHQQARLDACSREIQAVLARYGMRLDISQPQIVLTPAENSSS